MAGAGHASNQTFFLEGNLAPGRGGSGSEARAPEPGGKGGRRPRMPAFPSRASKELFVLTLEIFFFT